MKPPHNCWACMDAENGVCEFHRRQAGAAKRLLERSLNKERLQ